MSKLAIGVDLGGTHLRAALVDTLGGPGAPPRRTERKITLGNDRAPGVVRDRIASLVHEIASDAGPAAEGIPVGIGIAGMLRGDSGIVANAPNLGWRDVDLRGILREALPGRFLELYNDVNAIAFGEFAFGAGRGSRDMLCVFVGTGVGGGLICGGHLVDGASATAGEIGHMKVVLGDDARLCGCGQRGCIEAYAGGSLLAARARAELSGRDGPPRTSLAVTLAGGDPEKVHPGFLDQAAVQGDAYASRLWAEVTPLLGAGLANAVTLLNPGRLVLGGGVFTGAPEFKRRTLAAYGRFVNVPSAEACLVVDSALGDEAGILGSAALAAHG